MYDFNIRGQEASNQGFQVRRLERAAIVVAYLNYIQQSSNLTNPNLENIIRSQTHSQIP